MRHSQPGYNIVSLGGREPMAVAVDAGDRLHGIHKRKILKDTHFHHNTPAGDIHSSKAALTLPWKLTMPRGTGLRASAFTPEELVALVDAVLPRYMKLYGTPAEQVSSQWQHM